VPAADGAATRVGNARYAPYDPPLSAGARPAVPAAATYAEVMSTMTMVEVRRKILALGQSEAVTNMPGSDARWVAAGGSGEKRAGEGGKVSGTARGE